MSQSLPAWRRTHRAPTAYWLTGAFLLWLVLPATVVDHVLSPRFHMPHWQCDSWGILAYRVGMIALPAAVIALLLAAMIAVSSTWRRRGGDDVFAPIFGRSPVALIVTLVAMPLIALCLYGLGAFVFDVLVPKTVTADCAGRADPITVTIRRSPIQLTPMILLLLALWLLHVRALAASPRRATSRRRRR